MPCPKRKRDRLHQIHNWLKAEFPLGRATSLLRVEIIKDEEPNARGKREHLDGRCYKTGRAEFLIQVSPKLKWSWAIETLLHEYAHAMTWPAAHREGYADEHPDEWGLAYARLYRAFTDDGGMIESRHYPWN